MKVGGEGMWARGVEFGAGNGVGPRSRMRASFERKMRRRVRCQGAPKVWASMEREVQEYPRAEADRWGFRKASGVGGKGKAEGAVDDGDVAACEGAEGTIEELCGAFVGA